MKTILPRSITTLKEAKAYLRDLCINRESYHPDDDATDMIWGIPRPPSKKQAVQMNKLMKQIFDLPVSEYDFKADTTGEFPYGFMIHEERKQRLREYPSRFNVTHKASGHKEERSGLQIAENMPDFDASDDYVDPLHMWLEEDGNIWENDQYFIERLPSLTN